ncbi:MAG: AarF/ABC1/UbiB kinase family protein [Acidobacteriota bacterium]|nr:AarF/ABC1/UbiB kinase family protein [Acidobacteriota bacterium]
MREEWIPTQLIARNTRPEIPIDDRAHRYRFRHFALLGRGLGLVAHLLFLKLTGRLKPVKTGQLLCAFCQKMGLLWIKLGQLLAMRPDLLSQELCDELARLQDRALGFAPEQARLRIEAELGAPLNEIFSEFEDKPWAAASIGQVHRARLRKNGARVVIKVRRPGMQRAFVRDMQLIRGGLSLLERLSVLPFMHWNELLWELNQVFVEELDYRYEVHNQMRLRKSLARHQIMVPRVYRRYCTTKVLVMEFVDGVSMVDYLYVVANQPHKLDAWHRENEIDPDVVGRRLLFSFLRQVFEDKLFHADLHPGNIYLMRNNRLVLLDFGSIGTLERDLLRKYDAYLEALAKGEFAKAIDIFVLIAPRLPSTNLAPMKEELMRALSSWKDRCHVPEISYKEKSAGWVLDTMTKALARHGITIQWSFFKVLRGWTTLDTSLRDLIPSRDLPGLMTAYMKQRRTREMQQVMGQLPADLLRLQNLVDYPVEQAEMGIYRGANLRRLAQVFEGTTNRVSRLVAASFGFFSAAFLVGAAAGTGLCLYQLADFNYGLDMETLRNLARFPKLDLQVWLLINGFLAYSSFSTGLLAQRFRQQE